MDSMSADNKPMVLVQLTGLSYRYGPTIYAVDRVNGTMYGRYSRGFRMISERTTTEPQYRVASLAGMYWPVQPMHMSTLPGTTQLVTPLAESTSMTQSSQICMIPDRMPPVRDILEPISDKQARADYLERQLRHMDSISRLPSNVPLPELTTQRQDNLQKSIQDFCWENRVKRKQEWESHRMVLDRMKKYKEQQRQQSQEEWDVVYAQMLQEFEQT